MSDGFKAHSAFLKFIQFFRHLYWAIVIIMVEMLIMGKMAITTTILAIAQYGCPKNRLDFRNAEWALKPSEIFFFK